MGQKLYTRFGDGDEFLLWGWGWDHDTRTRPAPLPSLPITVKKKYFFSKMLDTSYHE